jgi:hypothetical protein
MLSRLWLSYPGPYGHRDVAVERTGMYLQRVVGKFVMAPGNDNLDRLVPESNYSWLSHCNGHFQTPIAA